uniref:Uncharacterized protein n=1 Tax=Rhizophora mucronata TaxID=61149 RepID=A0A2P2IZP2_RHIMU
MCQRKRGPRWRFVGQRSMLLRLVG